jgi:diguanylate cyclase (GGDEF)-like protein/PAS domain S-box-containing protein
VPALQGESGNSGLSHDPREELPQQPPHLDEQGLAWVHRLADVCGVDLLVTDPETGRFLDCNTSAHARLGYSRAELLAMGPAQIQADASCDALWVLEQVRRIIQVGGGSFSTSHRCRDGSVLAVKVSHTTATLGERTVLVSVVEDRSLHERSMAAAEAELALFREGERLHGIASWRHDLASDALGWTPQIRAIARSQPGDLEAYLSLVHPEDRERWRRVYQLGVKRGERINLPHRLQLADGSVREVHLIALPEGTGNGPASHVLGTLEASTGRRNLQQQILRARLRDPLTDLPNKEATLTWLGRQLNDRAPHNNLAIYSLDIDGFQEINDSFGHAIGDRLLKGLADLLQRHLAEGAWVARLGSDEFVVIHHQHIHSFGEAMQRARTLQQRLHAFDKLSPELPLRPTVSLGVSCFPEHGNTAPVLLQCANTALMDAKRQGRGQLRAYSTTLSRQIRERLVLDAALHKAIAREQLRILVQPQSDRDGRLSGGEVLLRWHHHQGQDVSPAFFIPLAEQSGLIFPLSDWVLQSCLEQISGLQRRGLAVPPLGLNISTRLLESADRHLVEQLRQALGAHGLEPSALELEITETALLRNPIAAAETVRQLASAGFHIAIDDFGTGYSSMELLRTLPVHKLKIDTTFIRDLDRSPEDQAIVQATITLAHGLGMRCIAEGVETTVQRDILLELGCDQFQGYLCGRPQGLEAFAALLQNPQLLCGDSDDGPPLPPSPPAVVLPTRDGRPSSFDELEALRTAIDASLDAHVLVQAVPGPTGELIDCTLVEANRSACTYVELPREGLVGQSLCTLFPGVVRSGLLGHLARCLQDRHPLELNDFVYANHEVFGDTRVYDLRAYPSNNLLSITWRDVTARSERTRTLTETAGLLDLLAQNVVETLVLFDEQQRVSWVSGSVQSMTGWRPEQWRGRLFSELFSRGQGIPEPVDLASWLPQPGEAGTCRLRLATPRGGWSWVDVSARRLANPSGGLRHQDHLPHHLAEPQGYVVSLRNADERELQEQRLRRLASHDLLTNLLNRSAVLQHLEQRLASGTPGGAIALVAINCNGFQRLNRRLGHAAGDAVLQELARRLGSQLRQGDRLARIGGDEFLVVLEGVSDTATAVQVADKLAETAGGPIPWGSTEMPISFAIGVAVQAEADSAEQLLRRVDGALTEARRQGGNQVKVG